MTIGIGIGIGYEAGTSLWRNLPVRQYQELCLVKTSGDTPSAFMLSTEIGGVATPGNYELSENYDTVWRIHKKNSTVQVREFPGGWMNTNPAKTEMNYAPTDRVRQ